MNWKLNVTLRRILPLLLLAMMLTLMPQAGLAQGWWKNSMDVVGSYNIPGFTTDVQISGTRAYLLTANRRPLVGDIPDMQYITILNIADPAKPQLLGTYYADPYVSSMAVVGTKVYILGSDTATPIPDSIYVLETSNPKQIPAPARIRLPQTANWGRKIRIHQSIAYIYDNSPEITIINPANPGSMKQIEVAQGSTDMAFSGSKAYILNRETLSIYDVTNPMAPIKLSQQSLEDVGRVLTVVSSRVYSLSQRPVFNQLAGRNSVLHIIQAYNPASPYPLGEYNTPGDGNDVSVYGPLAYIADGNQGVHVYDISQPLATDFVRGSYYTPSDAMSIKVIGSLAYVATGKGLLVLKYSGNGVPITLTQPVANATWKIGGMAPVACRINTKVVGSAVHFELWRAGSKVANLGNGYTSAGTSSLLQATVKVPATLVPATDYMVRVISNWDPAFWDQSNRITLAQ